MPQEIVLKHVSAGVLDVAYYEAGPADGVPTILLHGFPYDAHAYDEVMADLAGAGHLCIVPFLRGYGPTRFLSPDTPRSGEQAALGADLRALMAAYVFGRRFSVATTGVVEPPASSLRYGPKE